MASLSRRGWFSAFWRYLRDEEASIFGKLLAVFAVVYVVSPVDLIPDVPFVGWLDDIGVVALVGAWLTRRIAEYRVAPAHLRWGMESLPSSPSIQGARRA